MTMNKQTLSAEERKAAEYKRMTEAPVFGLVMRLSIPTTFSMLITSVYNLADTIIGTFRSGDTEVIEIGGKMLRYLCLSLPVLGYSTFVNQLYQTLGFVTQATLLASLRQGIFFIPLILILPAVLGITGIESAQAISDLLTCAVSVPFHMIMLKKYLHEPKDF